MRAPRTLAAALALALPACADDFKADFSPTGVIAVDAYLKVTFGDACRGGGKGSLCATDVIRDELSISIDDPGIARIVPEEEWPEGFVAAPGVVVLQGVWPGTTKIRGRARFSDGSRRSTSTKVSVKRMDRLELAIECQPDAGAPTRVLPGEDVDFRLVPMLGNKPLSGSFVEPVEPVEDESVRCENECTWEAPEEGGEVALRSSHDPKFRGTLSTYGPDDVTDVIVKPVAQPRVLGPGQVFDVSAHVALRGKMPCQNMKVQVKTLTPRICHGPEDEEAWSGGPYGFSVRGLSEGTCKLALGADGASDYPSEASLPLKVLSEFTIDHIALREHECSVEGASTCEHGFKQMLTCKKGVWVPGKNCGEKVCELRMRGEGGCKRAEGCAYCR